MTEENTESVVPVYTEPMSAQEIAEREQWIAEEQIRLQEEANKVSVRESALSKLSKLGLTEEEARAIIGL